jgi:hypothetical protein
MDSSGLKEAAAGLERTADYPLRTHTGPSERFVRVAYEAPATLLMLPNRGRLGKKEGTRELVMSPLRRDSSRAASSRSSPPSLARLEAISGHALTLPYWRLSYGGRRRIIQTLLNAFSLCERPL